MRATKSWIGEYAALPEGISGRELGEALVRAGLEVESVETVGGDVAGPVVIGRVLGLVEEPQKNGKVIRWCHVDVGSAHAPQEAPAPLVRGGVTTPLEREAAPFWPRGIVCGAHNFADGDLVVVALPGSELPGGFGIASRKTYGHISDGMICAEDELGIGSDHSGIIVLPEADAEGRPWVIGAGALDAMGVVDDVLEMPITSDMGYCLSVRGLAREAAQSLGVTFTDVVALPTPDEHADGHPVSIQTRASALFVALTVEGFDPTAATPDWMRQRLAAAGMRSLSLSVDVSNYVMLETGQPNHCYDADALRGTLVVRQAAPGEHLITLDDVDRALDPSDVVIADDRGPIGLAGIMGGEDTELRASTTRIVIEAAHFDPVTVARSSRRHKLSSEASRRFERWVDPGAAYSATRRVADLLVALGGGSVTGETVIGSVPAMPVQRIEAALPERVLGMAVSKDRVVEVLRRSGVEVTAEGSALALRPPTWRYDLVDPYDYVEEVGIKVGFDQLPSVVPPAPVGRGLSREQSARRALLRTLAGAGFVEVLTFPWASQGDLDSLGIPAGDERRDSVRLLNPLADTAPLLRTTVLPGLFGAVQRNASRGFDDAALMEIGRVFFSVGEEPSPEPGVAERPSDGVLADIAATLPRQPRHLGAVVAGDWRSAGWEGPAQAAGWQQVFGLAELAGRTVGVPVERRPATSAPWHPGRCAALVAGGLVVGYAGELHPSVIKAFSLPPRTAALELDLDALIAQVGGPGSLPPVSAHPVAKEDIALVVGESVSVADLHAAVVAGAGSLLEEAILFDIYRGVPVPAGSKSVAFALRFRAQDRTLTAEEVAAARDAAIAATAALGASLRAE